MGDGVQLYIEAEPMYTFNSNDQGCMGCFGLPLPRNVQLNCFMYDFLFKLFKMEVDWTLQIAYI